MPETKKRFTLNVEAKIIAGKKIRYVAVRYPRGTASGSYSYHYFSIEADDSLTKKVTRQVIKALVSIPDATDDEAAKFYNPIFEGDVDKIKKLRAKLTAR